MIKRIHLKNFSCFEDQEIIFADGRGTIKQKIFFIGENGSGKTVLLESIAFIKKLTTGLLVNDRLDNYNLEFTHPINTFILDEEVKSFQTIGFNLQMSLEFEFLINGDNLVYSLIFNEEGQLIKENLYKRTSRKNLVFFDYQNGEVEFGYGIILNKKESLVRSLIEKHKDNYTILSILAYSIIEDGMSVKEDLKNLVNFIFESFVSVKSYFYDLDYYNFFLDIKLDGSTGYVDEYSKNKIEIALPLMNSLVRYLYPHIESIQLKIERINDNLYKMEFVLKKNFKGQVVTMDASKFSEGLKEMIYLSYALLNIYEGKFVVVDDFTAKVEYKALEHLLNSMMIEFEQQVIVSLNGLDALELIDPSSIYIVHYRDGVHYVDALSDIASIRANHNIRKRYIEGVYTETPVYGKLPFREISTYRNEVQNLKGRNFTQNKVKHKN